MREVDTHTVVNSRVFVDVMQQGISENGELVIPIEEGVIDEAHVVGDLGGLVAGKITGREPDTKWTLFLSGGTGVDDVAVSTRLYQRALERGIGTEYQFNQPYEYEL